MTHAQAKLGQAGQRGSQSLRTVTTSHPVCPPRAWGAASAQPARGLRPVSKLWLRVFTPVCVRGGREGRGLCWGCRNSAGHRAAGRGGQAGCWVGPAHSCEPWVG